MNNPPNQQYDYDVFISYSSADKDWVRNTLLRRLQDKGLRACIDYRDFDRGAPTVKEIERVIHISRQTLLVLTPAYLKSGWTEFENLLLQTLDPTNQQRRLLPLLKEKCNLPTRISFLTYIDLAEPEDEVLSWTQLFTALGKPQIEDTPQQPTPISWSIFHPYPMPPNFTGRKPERQKLSQWLNQDKQHPLLILRALGGFGKSALTWHWLYNDVDKNQWQRVIWWSFYEEQASFNSFLPSVLFYLCGRDLRELPPRQQLEQLLTILRQNKILLILDGFERELRAYSSLSAAYQGDELTPSTPPSLAGKGAGGLGHNDQDCINPLADQFLKNFAIFPNIQSKVLMTTRLRPNSVEVRGGFLLQGCQEIELTQMQPADAVEFFQAYGVRGSRAEIEQACGRYGFHPLSLRLLLGLVLNDLQQPGDIQACSHLDITGDIVQQRNHVLVQAYNSLTPQRKTLLSQIACFRSPVTYQMLENLVQAKKQANKKEFWETLFDVFKSSQPKQGTSLQDDLRDLINRGLLQQDRRTNRYDLHPIVRRYAYGRMGDTERTNAHAQLRDYFAAVPSLEKVEKLEDLAPVIELYHHMVQSGQYDEARDLFRDRLHELTYYQLGAYQLQIDLLLALFPQGENHLPQLTSERAQGWTLNSLANSYNLTGQPRKALPLFKQSAATDERLEDKGNLAVTLENLAENQLPIGSLQAAESNLRRAIALCQEIEDELWETAGHTALGKVLIYRGEWAEAEAELSTALALFEKGEDIQSQGINWAYRALRSLLLLRTLTNQTQRRQETETALAAAKRALELAEETARTEFSYARDFIRAYWVLGAAQRVNSNLNDSDTHLNEALTRCRTINMVDHEANILLDLARLRVEQNQPDTALELAQEALAITERSGYVLQGADVHLFLAEQARLQNKRDEALTHAREARRLATCDGGEYTYKVAYNEAAALLHLLGESYY